MSKLNPWREYDEHEVTNLFAYDGTFAEAGTLVRVTKGTKNTDQLDRYALGATFNNTVSNRWEVTARVETCTSGITPVGILLYDVRETDENGELLKFNPRKAIEMNVALSGQAVPILSRGVILTSGIAGDPGAAGGTAYVNDVDNDGNISPTGTVAVGKFLGGRDVNGYAFVKLEL